MDFEQLNIKTLEEFKNKALKTQFKLETKIESETDSVKKEKLQKDFEATNARIKELEEEINSRKQATVQRNVNIRTASDFMYISNSEDVTGYSEIQIFDKKNKTTNKRQKFDEFLAMQCCKKPILKNGETKYEYYSRKDILFDFDRITSKLDVFKPHLSLEGNTLYWNPNIDADDVNYITQDQKKLIKPSVESIKCFKEFLQCFASAFSIDATKYYCNWFSQIVQDPKNKIPKAIMNIGGEGTGKSRMLELFRRVLGSYVSLSNDSLEDDSGSQRFIGKLLIGFEELFSGNYDSGKAFKTFISENKFTYKQKYLCPIETDNLSRVVVNSNTAATNISGEARRWYVVHSPLTADEGRSVWSKFFTKWGGKCADNTDKAYDIMLSAARWFFKNYKYSYDFIWQAGGEKIDQQRLQAKPEQSKLLDYLDDRFNGVTECGMEAVDNLIMYKKDFQEFVDSNITCNGINKLLGTNRTAKNIRFFEYNVKYNKNNSSWTFTKIEINGFDSKDIKLVVDGIDFLD